jgi:DNA polymerase
METELQLLDRRINERGVPVDINSLESAEIAIKKELRRLNAECKAICGLSATQRDAILKWLAGEGVELPDLTKSTVAEYLAGDDLPPAARRVLEIRQQTSKTSTAKVRKMLDYASSDGRMRGLMQYYGASRTGRWAGRGPQIQNYPRGKSSPEEVEIIIDALRTDSLDQQHDVMQSISDSLRAFIKAPDGYRFVVSDLAQIEARVLPWLARDFKTLVVFTSGGDIYKTAASRMLNIPVEQVTKDQRFIGKTATLALGYGGGHRAFSVMSKNFGVEISEDKADEIKIQWRAANRPIVLLWHEVESAARRAIRNPRRVFQAARCLFSFDKGSLRIQLPSTRKLFYQGAELDDRDELSSLTKTINGWERKKLWGGLLTENIVQAIARDILAHGMFEAERYGFKIIFHVHDELVCEVSTGDEELTPNLLEECMTVQPDWCTDLPLAAEGAVMKRYRK